MTTATKKMTSNSPRLFPLPLPFTELKDYAVMMERVKADHLQGGWDMSYAIVNKLTRVSELRGSQLALAVMMMQNCQQMLDRVRSGELNGYVQVSPVADGHM